MRSFAAPSGACRGVELRARAAVKMGRADLSTRHVFRQREYECQGREDDADDREENIGADGCICVDAGEWVGADGCGWVCAGRGVRTQVIRQERGAGAMAP